MKIKIIINFMFLVVITISCSKEKTTYYYVEKETVLSYQ